MAKRHKVTIGQVEAVEARKPLFDQHGRRIPPQGLQSAVCDANPNFYLVQPALDYRLRLARIVKYLQTGPMISAAEFKDRCEKLRARLRIDEQSSNILRGVCLPVCIPQTTIPDYGAVLDKVLLTAVGRSYKQQFPKRAFNNYRTGELEGQVTIIPGSRHEKLIKAMRRNVVVALYFPNCLQGFSVHADREQMAALPEEFLLSGGFDIATAMIAYPDILPRDFHTPGLDMAALQWQEPANSLCFGAHGGELHFGYQGDLGDALDYYSGGLLVLG